MQAVRIHTFETRYRLPKRALAERRRLDQVRALVLDSALERALDRAGVPVDGEICIRNLFAPVRLHLGGTDASLALDWSAALVREVSRALQGSASSNVVFYETRRQALMDLVISISRGDLRRVWAWRQLGLWSSRDTATENQAVLELAHALRAEPPMIVPALRALADERGIQYIANRLPEREWDALAFTALSAIGAAHLLPEADYAPSSRALRDSLRVLNGSRLLRAITSAGVLVEASVDVRRALAALAVLDAEPMLLRTDSAQIVIGVIAESMRTMSVLPQTARRRATTRTELRAPDSTERTRETEFEDADAIFERSDLARVAHLDPPDDGAVTSVDLRRRALTRFGGLLFLLGLIEDLCLPEEIIADAVLGARPFSWVTHQLALALLAIDANDPAALAFAGLPPDARPPSEEHEAPNENEVRATAVFAARIVERLGALLDSEDAPDGGLLEFVCRRRAEIVSDPGWIELRLSADDVSTEIRRAGLDLDPGYLSWLGVVVRFVYE